MNKSILLLSIVIFSAFTAGEKTADLKFTEQQYKYVQGNSIQAINRLDSLQVAISFMSGDNSKLIEMIKSTQQNVINSARFIGQIDSVFKK